MTIHSQFLTAKRTMHLNRQRWTIPRRSPGAPWSRKRTPWISETGKSWQHAPVNWTATSAGKTRERSLVELSAWFSRWRRERERPRRKDKKILTPLAVISSLGNQSFLRLVLVKRQRSPYGPRKHGLAMNRSTPNQLVHLWAHGLGLKESPPN